MSDFDFFDKSRSEAEARRRHPTGNHLVPIDDVLNVHSARTTCDNVLNVHSSSECQGTFCCYLKKLGFHAEGHGCDGCCSEERAREIDAEFERRRQQIIDDGAGPDWYLHSLGEEP